MILQTVIKDIPAIALFKCFNDDKTFLTAENSHKILMRFFKKLLFVCGKFETEEKTEENEVL